MGWFLVKTYDDTLMSWLPSAIRVNCLGSHKSVGTGGTTALVARDLQANGVCLVFRIARWLGALDDVAIPALSEDIGVVRAFLHCLISC